MYCEKCGNFNADGSPFCSSCGSQIKQQEIRHTTEKKRNKWPLLIVSLVLLSALVLGIVFVIQTITATNNDNQAIEKCLTNFGTFYNNSDTEGLISCFNKDTQDMVNAAMGVGSKVFGLDTSEVLNIVFGFGTKISGYKNLNIDVKNITMNSKSNAIADTTFYFDGSQSDLSLTLVKENGSWYISGLK